MREQILKMTNQIVFLVLHLLFLKLQYNLHLFRKQSLFHLVPSATEHQDQGETDFHQKEQE